MKTIARLHDRITFGLTRRALTPRRARSRKGSTMLETIIAYSLVGFCAWWVIDTMTIDDGILHTLWDDALMTLEAIIL